MPSYSGLVKSRQVELGELVNPGQALMTGMSLEKLRAVADAPQRIASQYRDASQIPRGDRLGASEDREIV